MWTGSPEARNYSGLSSSSENTTSPESLYIHLFRSALNRNELGVFRNALSKRNAWKACKVMPRGWLKTFGKFGVHLC